MIVFDNAECEGAKMATYVFEWTKKTSAIALGYGSIYNHSFTPNARYYDGRNQTKIFMAIRDIKAGEEITVNYNGDPKKKDKVDFHVIENAAAPVSSGTVRKVKRPPAKRNGPSRRPAWRAARSSRRPPHRHARRPRGGSLRLIEALMSSSEPSSTETQDRSLLDTLRFGASIPERLLRSAAGFTAGTAKELAEFLVPRTFQDSKTYEVVIRNSLNFVIGNIGGVELRLIQSSAATGELSRPQSRRELHGLRRPGDASHVAAVGPRGGQRHRLRHEVVHAGTAAELQQQGLIDDASTIHRIDDLLDAVQRASGTVASNLDQPPLSVDELRKSLEETRSALRKADPLTLFPEAEIARFWGDMRSLAAKEDVSLLGVSGVVAMQALSTVKAISQGTITSVVVATRMANRDVLGYYVDALSRINEQGLFTRSATLTSRTLKPFGRTSRAIAGPGRSRCSMPAPIAPRGRP